ncbi:MAG: hypothetical protein WD894_03125 [Pirellulales bacterium]
MDNESFITKIDLHFSKLVGPNQFIKDIGSKNDLIAEWFNP